MGDVRRVKDLDYSPADRSPRAIRARNDALWDEVADAHDDGRYGHAFTDEEMELARGLVRDELRKDPAAEILGLKPTPAMPAKRVDPAQAVFDEVERENREAEHPLAIRDADGVMFAWFTAKSIGRTDDYKKAEAILAAWNKGRGSGD